MSEWFLDGNPRINLRRRLFENSIGCECLLLGCVGVIGATLGMALLVQHRSHPVAFAAGIILTAASLYSIVHLSLLAWGNAMDMLLIHLFPGQRGFGF